MSAFDALKLGQKRELQRQKRKKPFQCDRCSQRFVNAGALATHQKSHPKFKVAQQTEPQSNVLDLLKERKDEKRDNPPSKQKPPQKSQRTDSKNHVKFRSRLSNIKKYRLVLQWELLKRDSSSGIDGDESDMEIDESKSDLSDGLISEID